MGRNKIDVEKRKTESGRRITYGKRRAGLFKKAEELSVLCDVDVALVTFSPTGKSTSFVGKTKDFADIVERYLRVDPSNREKRNHEIIQVLKRMYQDSDHEIQMDESPEPQESRRLQEQLERMAQINDEINETTLRLRAWTNPEEIDDIEQLNNMEEQIITSLESVQQERMKLEQLPSISAEKDAINLSKEGDYIPIFDKEDAIGINSGGLDPELLQPPFDPMGFDFSEFKDLDFLRFDMSSSFQPNRPQGGNPKTPPPRPQLKTKLD